MWASHVALVEKKLPANVGDVKRHEFNPWVRKIPWRRARQCTPIVLPRESHGHKSLVGYSPHYQKQLGNGLKQLSIHAGMHEMGEEGIQEISVCSSQFCCKFKTALHFKSLEKYIDFSKPAFFLNTMRVYVCTCMYAAAAAKSLQSCLTLCDPIDGSPPGTPVPGILQVRTLEWVAISFSNA